ncbi:tRNA (adenosine(37)-N6)-dimethylallyltransferase MiaA [Pseudohoeflea suaedae]|uniref:tRNA dimethylallyltransferase n=1 Tax=Pseudohoeflea suaedae TaxID=877384 RepID=A0A4R5PH48_9HYPH|nr:tRNA (adenosine(37)-N6)-dimethylallyltransferase MiaA [Pseudohoeflea suaedae]TDH34208.1 tRNA (adenosine(37)-N6)-dimethylallyltransferase MiaA [Pseudohoeflea suaedae]
MDTNISLEGKEAILIAGPTASGKSGLALDLARRFDGEVVNADSMQVYDGLRLLTARPSEEEMEGIPHHLYGHVPSADVYSTGRWLADAERAIADIRERGKIAIVVGGTGLYFRALTGGLSDIPPVPDGIRRYWREKLDADGVEAIHAELARRDPSVAAKLDTGDRQRVLRAVEVVDAHGRSIADFQTPPDKVVLKPENAVKLVLMPERAALYARINARFELMMEKGALEEVERLLALELPPATPVMKAIGVGELTDFLAGRSDMQTAVHLAQTASRQYAKRQMTWMRNQLDNSWIRNN